VVRALRRTAVTAATAALVLGAAGSTASPSLHGMLFERSMPSKALRGRLAFELYLPAGYATSTARYPVVYFLHGLPASPYAFRGMETFARALDEIGRPAIFVAPQGARDGDDDPEYLDWGTGRNWETAIGRELPRYVDSHYRTIASRRGRGLVGLSAGGYGAVLLALHHLDSYSVIESWSGYFHPTNRSGTAPLALGSPTSNRRASRAQLRAPAEAGVPAAAVVLRVLRGPRRRDFPCREPAPAPGAGRGARAARLRALPRRTRAGPVAASCDDVARPCAAASRPAPISHAFGTDPSHTRAPFLVTLAAGRRLRAPTSHARARA
jgi:enterochelin esterase-like enzyme